MSSVTIHFENIHLELGQKEIFNNFSMQIEPGEKVLLNAPSGGGKSSLIKLLLGFLRPSSGTIRIGEHVLSKSTKSYFRSQCSYVSQDVDLPNETVEPLIESIFELKANQHKTFDRSRLLDLMSSLRLDSDILRKKTRELSGGERQRLGFILCQLLDRPIWLLDEITSGLDADLKVIVRDMVLASPCTAVIISHDSIWDSAGLRKVRW